MAKLYFNQLPQREREQAEDLRNYVQSFIFSVSCYHANDKPDSNPFPIDCRSLFNHSIEEIIVLLYPFTQAVNAAGLTALIEDLPDLLFPEGGYEQISKLMLKVFVNSLEPFLKAMGYLVYKGVTIKVKGTEVDCYTGKKTTLTGNDCTGLDKMTLAPLLAGELKYDRFERGLPLPAVGGVKGFYKQKSSEPDRSHLRDLLYTVLRNRNVYVVHRNAPGAGDTGETDIRFLNVGGRDTLAIYQRTLMAFLLALDGQFDAVYEQVKSFLPASESTPAEPVDMRRKAEDAIQGKYLPDVIDTQTHVLRGVYWCTIREDQKELASTIIPIGLKEFDWEDNDDDDEAGYEELNMLDASELMENPENRRLLFLGGSGSGKSTLLARLILDCVDDWMENNQREYKRLPIRFNLCNYKDPSKGLMPYLLGRLTDLNVRTLHADQQEAVTEYFEMLLREGRVILCLDGVNEIRSDISRQVIDQLLLFMEKYAGCQYILTSRQMEIFGLKDMFATFATYQLCPLTEAQIKAHLRRTSLLYNGEDKQSELWEAINRVGSLKSFSRNPMQLMMLINIFKDGVAVNWEGLNKGELYRRFISGLIDWENQKNKSRSVTKDGLEEDGITEHGINMLLKFIGGLMWKNSAPGNMLFFDEVLNALMAARLLGGHESKLIRMLQCVDEMKLLERDASDNIRFTHDSFMEYYEALYFVSEFKQADTAKRKEMLTAIRPDFSDFEFLKLALELMESEARNSARGMRKENWAREFVALLLMQGLSEADDKRKPGETAAPLRLEWDAAARRMKVSGAAMPPLNPYLELLSRVTASLEYPEHTFTATGVEEVLEVKSVKARTYIECYLLNLLYLYKRVYPDGTVDLPYLAPLFRCASASGNQKVLDELFTPYWLRMWIVGTEDLRRFLNLDTRLKFYELPKVPVTERSAFPMEMRLLAYHLIQFSGNDKCLFDNFLQLGEWMPSLGFTSTLDSIQAHLLRLYASMEDNELKTLYFKIKDEPLLARHANSMLLMMNDASFLTENYNEKQPVVMYGRVINSLLGRYEQEEIKKFLFARLDQMAPSARIRVIRHYLMRNIYASQLMDYLWKEKGFESLGEYRMGVLDLMPLGRIPASVADQYYDKDIYEYQISQDEEEAYQGIGYFVFSADAETMKLAVPDIDFEFRGKILKMYTHDDQDKLQLEVKAEGYEIVNRCTVKIECVGDLVLLPSAGYVEGTGPDGKPRSLAYLAAMSNEKGLLIYTFSSREEELYSYWYEQDSLVDVAGVGCRLTHYAVEKRETMLRVLTVERPQELPGFRGRVWMYDTTSGKQSVVVNKALRTDYTCRNDFFESIRVEHMPKKGVLTRYEAAYAVYGYRNKSIRLWAEPLKSELENKYCKIKGLDDVFVVSGKAAPGEYFAELTLVGASRMQLPAFGQLQRKSGTAAEDENIPYIYRIVRGNNYILRVDDPGWLARLAQKEVVDALIAEEDFRVKNQYLQLRSVQLIRHNPQAVLLTLYAIRDIDLVQVPAEGSLRFYGDKDCKVQMLLGLGKGSRHTCNVLGGLTYTGASGGQSFLLVNTATPVPAGLYLKFDGVVRRYQVNSFAAVDFAARLRVELTADIPLHGLLAFDTCAELKFAYWVEGEAGENRLLSLGVSHSGASTLPPERLAVCISEATQLMVGETVAGIAGMESYTVLPEVKGRLVVSGTLDMPAGHFIEKVQLECYKPVVNSKAPSMFDMIIGRLYQVNTVSYHQSPENRQVLAIPKSATSVSHLYYKINGRGAVYPTRTELLSEEVTRQLSDLPLTGLLVPEPGAANLPQEGFIQFFFDEHALLPAQVGYDKLSSLVDYNKPDRYHSTVCGLLLKESREMERANPHLFHFFSVRNSSAELLAYYQTLSEEQFEGVKDCRFNICIVVHVSKLQVLVYSPLYRKVWYSEDISGNYAVNELVVLEKNNRLSRFAGKQRSKMLGYLEGVVLTVKEEKKEAFIHVYGEEKDYYFPFALSAYKPHPGDWVSFFPSINTHSKSRSMPVAQWVEYRQSVLRRGTVTAKDLIRSKNKNYDTIKVTVEDEATGFVSFAFYRTNTPAYYLEKVNKMEENSSCAYFLEKGEPDINDMKPKSYLLL